MNFVHKWPAAAAGAPGDAAAGDWILTGLVLAALSWTTLCLGGYRPETMVATTVLETAAFLVWLTLEIRREHGLRLCLPALLTVPFLGYAALNVVLISPVAWLGWRDWLGWAQTAAVFWVVLQGIRGARARETLFWGVVAVGAVAVAMAAYQRLADHRWLMLGRVQAAQFLDRSSGPFGIPNSLAAFLNLLLPPMLAVTFQRGAGAVQRVLCGYLAALLACGLLLTVSRGAWLALGVALAVWPVLVGRSAARRWGGSLGVVALLAFLAGAVYLRDGEVRTRVDNLLQRGPEPSRVILWRAGWDLFRSHPLLGTGAGSYDVLFERHRPARFWDDPQWAHNDYLNTLSDYGAVGFLLSFGMAGMIAWRWQKRLRAGGAETDAARSRSEQRRQSLQAGLGIGLLAFALQSFVDFNLKIPGLAQTAAALAGLALAPVGSDNSAQARGSIRVHWSLAVLAGLGVAVLVPWRALPCYRAEALRRDAREAMGRAALSSDATAQPPLLDAARSLLAKAVQLDPGNGQAWSDLADVMIQQARFAPTDTAELGREAEAASNRALDLSSAVAVFWVRRGLARDLEGRWRDAWPDFAEALRLAPNRADFWYYYAYHLSLRDLESAKAALANCLRLDPWNGPALAFRRLLSGH